MNTEECCNHNCNQGRDCPLRNKDLTEESFDRTASHMAGEYVSYPTKTLTDEEIWKLWVKHLNDDIVVFAREILKKASEK
jgi:hypothetical protein